MGSAPHSLSNVPFLDGLTPESRLSIEARCKWRTFRRGENIIDYLDSTNDVFFLTAGKGQVIIYSDDGKAVAFRDINVGDIFGELAAIDNRARSAAIEAVAPCTIARMSQMDFWSTLRAEPIFMERIVRHLAQQTRELTARIYEFSTLAVKNRIHAELYRLAQQHLDDRGVAHIRPIPHHSHIASRVSTTREAVARELNQLVRIGVLRRTSTELEVLDLGRLEEMIHSGSGS